MGRSEKSGKMLDLIFPPRCVLCQDVCRSGELCCDRCRLEVEAERPPLRHGDGSPGRPWSVLVCAFHYGGNVRGAISRFKFRGDMQAGEYLGRAMAKLVTEMFPPYAFDVVVPVPMPQQRQKQRGYNQAEILAGYVAEALGIPVVSDVILRQGVFAQHQLTVGFRRRETAYSFRCGKGDLRGKRVLLVDDVITTGSTAAVCCHLLREMGAVEISVVAAAGE